MDCEPAIVHRDGRETTHSTFGLVHRVVVGPLPSTRVLRCAEAAIAICDGSFANGRFLRARHALKLGPDAACAARNSKRTGRDT
jgi:hypothetical protein